MPVQIPVKKLQSICDPFANPPWGCPHFGRKAVAGAIKRQRFNARPFSDGHWNFLFSSSYHTERIAYLAHHGWDDPIQMDVGVPSLHCYVDWPVMDGNHRLAAAIYRKDATILACVGGDIDYALELFGVDVSEPTY